MIIWRVNFLLRTLTSPSWKARLRATDRWLPAEPTPAQTLQSTQSRNPPCWNLSTNTTLPATFIHHGRGRHDTHTDTGRWSPPTVYSPAAVGSCRSRFSQQSVVFCWCTQKGRRIPPSWAQKQGTPEEEWTHLAVVGSLFHLRQDSSRRNVYKYKN